MNDVEWRRRCIESQVKAWERRAQPRDEPRWPLILGAVVLLATILYVLALVWTA